MYDVNCRDLKDYSNATSQDEPVLPVGGKEEEKTISSPAIKEDNAQD